MSSRILTVACTFAFLALPALVCAQQGLQPAVPAAPPAAAAPESTDAVWDRFGLKLSASSASNILVDDVRPGSLAARAGIEKGDEVSKVANVPVANLQRVQERLLAISGEGTLDLSMRRSGTTYVTTLSLDSTKLAPAGAGTSTTPTASAPESNFFGMFVHEGPQGHVLIDQVSPLSPAAKAGIQAGDVLVSVGGHPASPISQLMPFAAEVVQRKQRGMTVPIEIMRNNSVTVVQILGTDNAAANANAAAQGTSPVQQEALAAEAALLGLGLRDVSPNTVSVTRVAVASPAAVAGLVPGDVIGTVDQSQVSTVAQFVSLIGVRQMGDQLNLVVLRDGKPFPTTLLMTPRLQDVSQASVAVATTVIHQEIKALEERLQSLANEVQRLEVQGPSSAARK